MIIVWVDHINARWVYTLDFIFKSRGIRYDLTDNRDVYETSPKLGVNASSHDSAKGLRYQSIVLDENQVVHYQIEYGKQFSQDCLQFNGTIDLLGSIFFVLSRYEEYIIKSRDKHGRFSARNSYQYIAGWLNQPICDVWAVAFIRYLEYFFTEPINFVRPPIKIIPTFDIDHTFAYLERPAARRNLSLLKDLIRFNFKRIRERYRVLKHLQPDPYNTFSTIQEIAADHFDVKVFWLVGDYDRMDRNIHFLNPHQRRIIRQLSENMEIGIHPSYASNFLNGKVRIEIDRLQRIIGPDSSIKISRQHFLKMELPDTYQNLQTVNIREDYTMGYAECGGYRMGTAQTLKWFDLERDNISDLFLFPLIYMDGTLLEYQKLSIHQAKEEVRALFEAMQPYGGNFTFLWHNETIGNYGKWKGWSEVLNFTLSLKKYV